VSTIKRIEQIRFVRGYAFQIATTYRAAGRLQDGQADRARGVLEGAGAENGALATADRCG